MVPEKDIVLDREVMFHCASHRANVRLVEVDGADHFISLERPEFVRAIVRRLHEEGEAEALSRVQGKAVLS